MRVATAPSVYFPEARKWMSCEANLHLLPFKCALFECRLQVRPFQLGFLEQYGILE